MACRVQEAPLPQHLKDKILVGIHANGGTLTQNKEVQSSEEDSLYNSPFYRPNQIPRRLSPI